MADRCRANLALVGCLVLWARGGFIRHAAAMDSSRPGGSFRAALLAVAAGSTFGLTAALMKAMTRTLAGGIGDLLTAWPVYAMGWYILGEVSCAGAIIAGVIMLARSPLLSQDGSAKEDQSPGGSPGGSPGQEQAQVTMTATGSTGSMIRSYVSFIAWAAM